ncbi:Protein BRI1-5 ENHANCED 1 [Linum grandiflorum]
MAENRGIVCVTGGTGFIASSLISRLLHLGYTVHTTLRSNSGKRDISYLTTLPGAEERLRIFEANLEEPATFSPAFRGCRGVFHVAHSSESTVERAVEATVGVLRACADSKTVKRVVFTSSLAAAAPNGKGAGGSDVDESTWTDVDGLGDAVDGVAFNTLSVKTATEKAALEFARRNGMDLVTLLPAVVVGSFITPALPASVKLALGLLFGNKHVIYGMPVVDIEDVVRAHIFVMECVEAKGRYICSSANISLVQMWEFLSANYPYLQLPLKETVEDMRNDVVVGVSSKKLLVMGFEFKHGLGHMVDGAIQSCRERGLI